jgi:hypothetical protein
MTSILNCDMMEKKRSRPSKSKEWITHSRLSLYLDDKDEVHHYTTDKNGNVQTKKRSWAKLYATLIEGTHKEVEKSISIPKETHLWYCTISTYVRCSSI